MERRFVSNKIAVLLKELGFDEECFAYFDSTSRFEMFEYYDFNRTNSTLQSDYGGTDKYCTAPLWQQVEEWLRELHNIQLSIFPNYDGDGVETVWDCNIINLCWGHYKEHHIEDYIRNSDKDRSKCLETAILRALELLTTKNREVCKSY